MKIRENIYHVGVVDWNLRKFHGYSTPYGTTYNAYLITGEKNILIDTVKPYCADEFIQRIEEIIPVEKIDYVITNHAEMDHSGTVDYIISKSNATLICSPKCKENLEKHFHSHYEKIITVENGEQLTLGNVTLKFIHIPMVHWPESMATYLVNDEILFPNDAFGQHLGCSKIFVDEVGIDIVIREAKKYYANIVNPYGTSVKKVMEALKNIPLKMIAPSHGLIWRNTSDIQTIIKKYNDWANNTPGDKILIVYNTMWHSTEKLAKQCYIKATEKFPAEMFDLEIADISDVVAEIPDAKLVLFGSSILHNQILPQMAGLLTYLTGLKFKNRKAWTFGSYGWSNVPFEKFEKDIKSAGFDLLSNGYYVQFVPDKNNLVEIQKIFVEKILGNL